MAIVTGTALAAAPAVSISARPGLIVYTHEAALTGRLADHRAGVTVHLEARSFGKPSFQNLTTARTGASGVYRFVVAPALATAYRAVARSGKSAATTVYVSGRVLSSSCNLCVPSPPAGHQTLRVSLRYQVPGPAYQHELEKPLYFYYATSSHGPVTDVRLVKTFKQTAARGGVIVASARYRVVMGPGIAFHYVICIRDSETVDGLGLPGHHFCGNPVLSPAEYGGYLG